jgi:hypothetical protein
MMMMMIGSNFGSFNAPMWIDQKTRVESALHIEQRCKPQGLAMPERLADPVLVIYEYRDGKCQEWLRW